MKLHLIFIMITFLSFIPYVFGQNETKPETDKKTAAEKEPVTANKTAVENKAATEGKSTTEEKKGSEAKPNEPQRNDQKDASMSVVDDLLNGITEEDLKIRKIDDTLAAYFKAELPTMTAESAFALIDRRAQLCGKAPEACLDISKWYPVLCKKEQPVELVRALFLGVFPQVKSDAAAKGLNMEISVCPDQPWLLGFHQALVILTASVNSSSPASIHIIQTLESKWSKPPPEKELAKALDIITKTAGDLSGRKPANRRVSLGLSAIGTKWLNTAALKRILDTPAERLIFNDWILQIKPNITIVGQNQIFANLLEKFPQILHVGNVDAAVAITVTACPLWEATQKQAECRKNLDTLSKLPLSPAHKVLIDLEHFRLERTLGNFKNAIRFINKAMVDAKAVPKFIPWVYLSRAALLKDMGRLDKADEDAKIFFKNIPKESRQEDPLIYFGVAILQELAIARKKYPYSIRLATYIKKQTAQFGNEPTILSFWVNFHQLMAAVAQGSQASAKEYHKLVIADAKALPIYTAFAIPFADALLGVLSGKDPKANLKAGEAVLGVNHPDMVRVRKFVTELTTAKK